MTYNEFIQNILNSRGRFACGEEYHERHHIVPKCIGGSNDDENLIDLYAREHYEAHKLLMLENPDNRKLHNAYFAMAFLKCDNHDRYQVAAEEYEYAKQRLSQHKRKIWQDEDARADLILKIKNGCNTPEHKEYCRKRIEDQRNDTEFVEHCRAAASDFLRNLWQDESFRQRKIELQIDRNKKRWESPEYREAHTKKVVQYSKCGDFIKEWESVIDAEKALHILHIGECANKKRKTAGGFVWEYID